MCVSEYYIWMYEMWCREGERENDKEKEREKEKKIQKTAHNVPLYMYVCMNWVSLRLMNMYIAYGYDWRIVHELKDSE